MVLQWLVPSLYGKGLVPGMRRFVGFGAMRL